MAGTRAPAILKASIMKTFPLCLLIVAAGLLAGVPSALAADASNANANPRFDRLDQDGDGRISRAEFLGSVREKKHWWQKGKRTANTDQNSATPEMFTAMDRNADGYLSNDELNSSQRLQESRGDNGEGASRTRNVHPPGDPNGSQKTESETAADKRAPDQTPK
jgi:hypothetical protein